MRCLTQYVHLMHPYSLGTTETMDTPRITALPSFTGLFLFETSTASSRVAFMNASKPFSTPTTSRELFKNRLSRLLRNGDRSGSFIAALTAQVLSGGRGRPAKEGRPGL